MDGEKLEDKIQARLSAKKLASGSYEDLKVKKSYKGFEICEYNSNPGGSYSGNLRYLVRKAGKVIEDGLASVTDAEDLIDENQA